MIAVLSKYLMDITIPEWLNINHISASNCYRREIYLPSDEATVVNLISSFLRIFENDKKNIIISNGIWGGFCLDTFDVKSGQVNFHNNDSSDFCKIYRQLLVTSNIEFTYDGFCECNNWDEFLSIIIPCIINHAAPYSPLFYNVNDDYALYFHHTYSIGFLYQRDTEKIKKIMHDMVEDNLIIEVNDIKNG